MHDEILKDALNDDSDDSATFLTGPIKFIIGFFLLFLLLLMIIPYYSIKLDPSPSYIPNIEEVLPSEYITYNLTSYDYRDYVLPSDKTIKSVATKVSSLGCEYSKVCHAKVLYYFVRDNIKYVADPLDKEYLETGAEVMQNGGADCESGSILLASLMESVGIDTQFVLITGHAYIRVKLDDALSKYKDDDGWVYLDWTCKTCDFGEIPWQNLKKRASYMDV